MSKAAPIVAIVGRANVGKSSLFNAVLGRREAIVAKEAGTTRDRVSAKATWGANDFWLVDTAGLKTASDEFEMTIQQQISEAASSADLIWVVVDAGVRLTEEDRRVSKLALKTKKPVLLVVNKQDTNPKASLDEWLALGISAQLATSTTQRRGIAELLDATAQHLPRAQIRPRTNRVKIAILGRPNVGKSALFNALCQKQQAIVAKQAGTTRDVNRSVISYHDRELELLDTAGIRRSGKIERGVEQFSVLRALAAIEEADVCLLVMEYPEVSVQLDQKIGSMICEAGKGLTLVVSKWDNADSGSTTRQQVTTQITRDFAFIPWAPLLFTSSVTGLNITKIFDLATQIAQERTVVIKTSQLNQWLQKATSAHPPAGLKNYHPNLKYMVQEDTENLPSFKIFGSHTRFLHWSYRRYLERSFRESWPFMGTPIKFWFIDDSKSARSKGLGTDN